MLPAGWAQVSVPHVEAAARTDDAREGHCDAMPCSAGSFLGTLAWASPQSGSLTCKLAGGPDSIPQWGLLLSQPLQKWLWPFPYMSLEGRTWALLPPESSKP